MAFGNSPLVSDFTGADENPLSESGKWSKVDSNSTALRRISNMAGSSVSSTAESYWNVKNFGPDVDVYATIVTIPLAGNHISVSARIQQEGGAGTYDGYRLFLVQNAGTDDLNLAKVTNSATATLGILSRDFVDGEKIGIRCVGTSIEGWYFTAGAWNLGVAVVDTTYSAAGKIALHIRGTTGRVDDFFASDVLTDRVPIPAVVSGGVRW